MLLSKVFRGSWKKRESVSCRSWLIRLNPLFNLNVHCRHAMDTDITSTQPISSSSLTPLLSSSPLLSEKTDTPTPTSQSRRRSPTRKPSSIIIPLKLKPPRKPRKHRQPATIDAPSSQLAHSATSPSAKELKKPAMHVHRMLRVEVPDDAIGVQVGQFFPLIILIAQISQYLEPFQTTLTTL